jgi:hypothetical protein
MTDADELLMGRADLERAFTALGERLARRGVVADLFVVGSAAMALAYDANRVTRDVAAMFVPHGVVVAESRAVAEELGLPPWWLNEQASVYVSGKDDPGKRRVFDHPNLRIMSPRPNNDPATACWRLVLGAVPPYPFGVWLAPSKQGDRCVRSAGPRVAARVSRQRSVQCGCPNPNGTRPESTSRLRRRSTPGGLGLNVLCG